MGALFFVHLMIFIVILVGMRTKSRRVFNSVREFTGALVGACCVLVLVALVSCCSASSAGDDVAPSEEMVASGSWYVRHPWPHDGSPIESENFVVYSDAASLQARRAVAEESEKVLAETMAEMGIDPRTMFRFPPGQDKIDIYAYHDYHPQDWEGRAYYGGLLMWSPDHEQRQTDARRFAPVLKHELVHVVQYLIMGGDSTPFDVWFIEGLPEAIAGGTSGGAIRGLDQLDDLTADYGTVSPISMRSYSQITGPEAGARFYYPMFQLAVEYLIDDDGHGRSPRDATDLMIDIADGAPFETAFETRMGIRLDDFEAEFFNLISAYLPQYRSRVFTPTGFALVSTLVVVFVIGTSAVGYRRWRPGAATGGIDRAGPGWVARISFYSEITIATVVVIVAFLGVLFAVGTEERFNNAMYSPARTRAYWTLASYLLASVGLLLWASHRWIHHSRYAFLVAPLAIVATGTTVFFINAML